MAWASRCRLALAMVKIWRAGTDEPFEFGQADGAHENAGKLVLTRRKKEARKPEVFRVLQAGMWAVAEVYDCVGSCTETIAAT
jgi:hypothetical protein